MGLNPFKRERAVVRNRKGLYELRLDDEILEVLAGLADQLDPLLDDPSADQGLRRLFPPAHTEDVLAEAAWQIEQGGQLRDSRRAALEALRTANDAPMDEPTMIQWMQGINALRLVLAERLQVTDDEGHEEQAVAMATELAASDDPEVASVGERSLMAWSLYDLMGLLVHDSVEALGID